VIVELCSTMRNRYGDFSRVFGISKGRKVEGGDETWKSYVLVLKALASIWPPLLYDKLLKRTKKVKFLDLDENYL